MTNISPEQIADWKRLAEAATAGPWAAEYPMGTPSVVANIQGAVYDWTFIAHADTGNLKHSVKAYRNAAFIAAARTAVPALIAEVERLKAERDAAHKALRVVQSAAKTLAHSRDSELQHLRENRAYDHKLRAEHDSLIERDSMMTDRIAALEAERDALKDAVKPFVEAIRWSKIGFLHLDIGKITTEDLRIARRTMENSND